MAHLLDPLHPWASRRDADRSPLVNAGEMPLVGGDLQSFATGCHCSRDRRVVVEVRLDPIHEATGVDAKMRCVGSRFALKLERVWVASMGN